MSELFMSGGQSIGASASVYMLPLSVQSWFPLGLTCLISLLSKVISRVFSYTTIQNHQFFSTRHSLWSNSHICIWLQGRRKWQHTPILLPGKFHGWRSLVGYSPWGSKELDMTERLDFTSQGRPELWLYGPLLAKWYHCFSFYFFLCFLICSRFVITFLPRSKSLLNFMAAVTIHSDFGA